MATDSAPVISAQVNGAQVVVSNNQAIIGMLGPFESEQETWSSYIDRFELFSICNNIDDGKKACTLLTVMGLKTYSLIKDLCTPLKPAQKTYVEIVKLVEEHLHPTPSFIAERYKFSRRNQMDNESIAQYLQHLKHLSTFCQFGANLNDYLRDRLVSGIANERIKQKLLGEGIQLTLERAVQLSTAMESMDKDVTSLAWNRDGRVQQVKVENKFEKRDYSKKKVDINNKNKWSRPNREGLREDNKVCTCNCCGRTGHLWKQCRYKEYKCRACGRKGHLIKKCKNNKVLVRDKVRNEQQHYLEKNDETELCEGLANMFNMQMCGIMNRDGNYGATPIYVKVKINGMMLKMEIDTGSPVTVVSEVCYRQLFSKVKLENTSIQLSSYTNDKIKIIGKGKTRVSYNDKEKMLTLYVIENGGPPLMGRDWIEELQVLQFNLLHMGTTRIFEEFPEVFSDKLGTYTKGEIQLKLKEEVKPKFFKPRPIPFALRDKVEVELDRLVKEGILKPVESSEWGTPIVPVLKKNGHVRICGDFKVTLNPQLEIDRYPIPRIEDLINSLNKGQIFSKIDLSHAYQQVLLKEESRQFVTISTHKGAFEYTRIPYGVASAPGLFQRIMEQMVMGMPGVIVFLDDILVTGENQQQHMERLKQVCTKLKDYGFTVSKEKCEINVEAVEYLGFVINGQGVQTAKSKVEAVKNAPIPQNVTQLKAFLGLINYYGKFVSNLATELHPLYQLLKKDVKWNFSEKCVKAFVRVKELLISSSVLAHFRPELPLRLAADASAYGIGSVLSQVQEDGTERPIAFASRTLNKAEQAYSQVDKEALSLIFGVKKFNQYVWGRHFTLITDHKPLLSIFGSKKGLPAMAASRLQRYALLLSGYDFDIVYRKSENHGNADALSRLPLNNKIEESEEYTYLNFLEECRVPLNMKDIRRETAHDALLLKVLGYVKYGWPVQAPEELELQPFWRRREQLAVEQEILMWGYRVVIPEKFRGRLLAELHESHLGMVKVKSLARAYLWWPQIDADIETMIRGCEACLVVRANPVEGKLHVWDYPTGPWQRVHMDYKGPFFGHLYLVVKDAYSKWLEVFEVPSTAATPTIKELRRLFARFGIPANVVTDNGPPFTSSQFKEFMEGNGIRHSFSPPFHPQTNGLAENAVKTLKKILKISRLSGEDPELAINKFLLDYRNTVHCTTNETPAKLMFNRHLRTRLDLLRPDLRAVVKQKEVQNWKSSGERKTRELYVGQPVLVRAYKDSKKWVKGIVNRRIGIVTYEIKIPNVGLWKRHIDQILASELKVKDPEEGLRPVVEPVIPVVDIVQGPVTKLGPTVALETEQVTVASKGEPLVKSQEKANNVVDLGGSCRRSGRIKKPVVKMNL